MSDTDWMLIVKSGHWDCLGWAIDDRGALVCACGETVREPEEATA